MAKRSDALKVKVTFINAIASASSNANGAGDKEGARRYPRKHNCSDCHGRTSESSGQQSRNSVSPYRAKEAWRRGRSRLPREGKTTDCLQLPREGKTTDCLQLPCESKTTDCLLPCESKTSTDWEAEDVDNAQGSESLTVEVRAEPQINVPVVTSPTENVDIKSDGAGGPPPTEAGCDLSTENTTANDGDAIISRPQTEETLVSVSLHRVSDSWEDVILPNATMSTDTTEEQHLPPSNQPSWQDVENEDFMFVPSEEETHLSKNIQDRVARAIRAVAAETLEESDESESSCSCADGCFNGAGCTCTCRACLEYEPCKCPGHATMPVFTPQLKVASNQGLKMMRKALFPAVPKFIRDIWVYTEIAVVLMQFILSIVSLSLEGNQIFNVIYLLLSAVNVVLCLLDGFIHFVQLGSCAQCIRCSFQEVVPDREVANGRKWWKLSPKRQEQINEWFEVIRNVATELLIYPLLICDLFDFIAGGSRLGRTVADRINYSLFIISAFYLFISVYFMRIFVVISAVVTLRKIPVNSSRERRYADLISQFCIHVLAQICVHAMIIIAVGVKIHQENSNPTACANNNGPCVNASGFLIYSSMAGGAIPLFGVVAFFLVNYYEMRELSVGFWIDMLSLLERESFADLVFQGEGMKMAKKKATLFIDKVKQRSVEEQFNNLQSPHFLVKALYPFRIPTLIILGILYETLLISFIVTLLFEGGADSGVSFVLFQGRIGVVFFMLVCLIILANLHVLLLVSLWIAVVALMLLLVALTPVFVLLFFATYAAFGAVLTCAEYLRDKLTRRTTSSSVVELQISPTDSWVE